MFRLVRCKALGGIFCCDQSNVMMNAILNGVILGSLTCVLILKNWPFSEKEVAQMYFVSILTFIAKIVLSHILVSVKHS